MRFSQAANKLKWELQSLNPELEIGHPCIDSRVCEAGNLFWALKGQRDGAEFAADAFAKGAQAIVTSKEWIVKVGVDKPMVIVDDVLQAMTNLAGLFRRNFSGKVLALTGSCGKTTAKELIFEVLSRKYQTLKSPASFNNHIGLPFTLCSLKNEHQFAVIEIGANHPREIAGLCEIARPEYGLITMVGRAHLEGFGFVAGIAEAKGELFRGLSGEKIAFVNFDDAYVLGQSKSVSKRIGYGFNFPPVGQGFARIYKGIEYPGEGFSTLNERFQFPFPDYLMHHGLSAVAVGHFFGIPTPDIVRALKDFKGIEGRMMRLEIEGVILYDDTYNANPTSMNAALKFVASIPGGKKFAVLGDMLELGNFSEEEHRRILETAKTLDLERIFTIGENFAEIDASLSYRDKDELAADLCCALNPGDVVLFKGSRLIKTEEILRKVIRNLKGEL